MTTAVKISIDNIARATDKEPAKAKYTITIPRENGSTQIRGSVPIGDSFEVTKEELAGD